MLYLTGNAAINGTGNDDSNYISGNGAANKLTRFGRSGCTRRRRGERHPRCRDGRRRCRFAARRRWKRCLYREHIGRSRHRRLSGRCRRNRYRPGVRCAYALGKNFENLTLVGAAVEWLRQLRSTNVLIGNDLNNTLDGLDGADTMSGGKGDDTYGVDSVGDVVKESAGGGHDSVVSTISYTLATEVEDLKLAFVRQVRASRDRQRARQQPHRQRGRRHAQRHGRRRHDGWRRWQRYDDRRQYRRHDQRRRRPPSTKS